MRRRWLGRPVGSSPHTRGTRASGPRCRPLPPVHPRIRGERHRRPGSVRAETGSSPHTRGTLEKMFIRQRDERFIPAYAGNALRNACLELGPTGSSPHTRGTPAAAPAAAVRERFIPAYAGNAGQLPFVGSRSSVHPRIRGERLACSKVDKYRAGSSPHTRGTRQADQLAFRVHRFIPAYAGNAQQEGPRGANRAVHPRIRGERPKGERKELIDAGSSPHTRGTPPGQG